MDEATAAAPAENLVTLVNLKYWCKRIDSAWDQLQAVSQDLDEGGVERLPEDHWLRLMYAEIEDAQADCEGAIMDIDAEIELKEHRA